MYLPDVNVWLPLVFSQHVHHQVAEAWFASVPDDRPCFFCRLTQMGFLRLATNPKANPLQTLTMRRAWEVYQETLLDPRIEFAVEPEGLEDQWRQYAQTGTFSPHVWNDAYLAAFAQAADLELVTFDYGFKQYADVTVTHLK